MSCVVALSSPVLDCHAFGFKYSTHWSMFHSLSSSSLQGVPQHKQQIQAEIMSICTDFCEVINRPRHVFLVVLSE